tara:strand:+ start:1982 stop:2665 length:684 start_codon:yes stop_codon:yes gene_type:complete
VALYPLPFDVLDSDHSFGKILLDIQIDHPSRSYQFVYRAQDRIAHVIRDNVQGNFAFGSINGVGFRSSISQYDEQWNPDVLLPKSMNYDTYCQQDSRFRYPTSLTVLLDTKYNNRPVLSYNGNTGDRRNFLVLNQHVAGYSHGDLVSGVLGLSGNYEYLANHYRVELRVTGSYTYPTTEEPIPGETLYPVYLIDTDDGGILLSDPPVTSSQATALGYTIQSGKAFIF